MKKRLLIKGSEIITLDQQDRCLIGDLLIDGSMIAEITPHIAPDGDTEVIDARGLVMIPGFVQTHIHLCQTLFRGSADDLSLIDWLKQRIWPLEASHTPESLYNSAQLGIAELITGGTTCALSMETVHHTDAVFAAVEESGFRATLGKCMMDLGSDRPEGLREETRESIEESLRLLKRWHGVADGRIRYCFAPRFAVSCTRELLEETALHAKRYGVMIHTHASENKDEIELVRRMTGRRNIEYLRDVGIAGPNVVLAHCIHVDRDEIDILSNTRTRVAHCPSSNLKLGSGIAKVPELIDAGIEVSLGADGAPCNNRLDIFTEMRTAALLQKFLHGPRSMPANTVLKMATTGGARALGLEESIGSIAEGKRADLVLLDLNRIHTTPHPNPISTIVYAADRTNIEVVIIDGKVVLRNRQLQTIDETRLISRIGEMGDQHKIADRP